MIHWTTETFQPLGPVLIAEVDGHSLIYIGLGENDSQSLTKIIERHYPAQNLANEPSCLLDTALHQIDQYLSGERKVFDLPITLAGTSFQQRVWGALAEIPYGQTATYGEIAAGIDARGAVRAVGQACGANPLPLIIPCHRVVACNGLGGFSGGLWYKRMLLAHEGISL